ncbi:LysR substrate-binding domain-containing protein [Nitrincola sp. MINF-07-Sa-05]|uniref:LysR substrate-binding domain-containing protein n=1 Tax=Nitrincola salilacus TaxID=3400273 RepID=UPI0039183142
MRAANLNGLRIFEAVARHLNFRKAAEELHLTQSAVAQRIRRMETDLGISLFVRKPRGVELTDEGSSLYGAVVAGLGIMDDALRRITTTHRQVVISVPPSFGAKWLIPRLADFHQACPDIDLRISASEAVSSFRNDDVDFVVRYGEASALGKGLHFERLTDSLLCAVANPAYRDLHPEINQIEDFTHHRLIEDSHGHWEHLARTNDQLRIDKILHLNQTSMAIDAAVAGQGICIAPRILLESHLGQQELVVLMELAQPDDKGFYLVYPEGREFDSFKLATITWLRSQALAYRQ